MCGFVGVLHPAELGPVSEARMRALLPWIRHRGPDQEAVHCTGGVGLAVSRLSIRGGDAGNQPVVAEDGDVVLVFNGQLFDRVPAGQSDTRWLLERYLEARVETDEDEVEHRPEVRALERALRGAMGTVVVFDRQAGWLHLVPTWPPIKPLHVGMDDDGALWFASEMTPLLAAVPAFRQPEPSALFELMAFHGAEAGPFRGIDLGACIEGHHEMLDDEGFALGMPATRPMGPRVGWTPGEGTRDVHLLADAVARAFGDAARQAATVDGGVSLFLSGGLDSSAVAAWAQRPDLQTLTGRFPPHGDDNDESDAARAVAAQHGLPWQAVDLDPAQLLEDLQDVIHALEMPVGGPGSLALWRMAQVAREHGRVVLTGTGGDELLGGYARIALLAGRSGPWTAGYEPLQARLAALEGGAARRVLGAYMRTGDLEPVLAPDFVAALREEAPPIPDEIQWAVRTARQDEECLLLGALGMERRRTLTTLLHVEDRVLMAHGLEGRPVACLGELPALALSLGPRDLLGPDGEGKRPLRAALEGAIPDAVRLDPRKRGFPTPFATAARGPGRAMAEGILSDQRFRERGWWDAAACRALLDEDRPAHDRALFMVLAWELWARAFLDGDRFAGSAAAAGDAGRGAGDRS